MRGISCRCLRDEVLTSYFIVVFWAEQMTRATGQVQSLGPKTVSRASDSYVYDMTAVRMVELKARTPRGG